MTDHPTDIEADIPEVMDRGEGAGLMEPIDQVAFMETLVQPDRLRMRILLWAEVESRPVAPCLPCDAGAALDAGVVSG
jgi:hypothetical protein